MREDTTLIFMSQNILSLTKRRSTKLKCKFRVEPIVHNQTQHANTDQRDIQTGKLTQKIMSIFWSVYLNLFSDQPNHPSLILNV